MSKNELGAGERRGVSLVDGGGRRDRTDDLLLAKQALSQLSYAPGFAKATPGKPAGWLAIRSACQGAKDGGPGRI